MKHLKLYEEYDPKKHQIINVTRNFFNKKSVNRIMNIISIIDDLVHLDFKNIKNTFKNKDGYEKASKLASELGILLTIMKDEGNDEMDLFYNIRRYGFDVDMIINYLEDENVIKYLSIDKRLAKKLDEYKEGIDFLKKYKIWNDKNNQIFR